MIQNLNKQDSLKRQLKAATFEKTKVQTKALREKLEKQRSDRYRQEIWNRWNEEFFQCFAEAFSKVKNELNALHLTSTQLKVLQDEFDSALNLKSLQTKLGLGKEDSINDDKL